MRPYFPVCRVKRQGERSLLPPCVPKHEPHMPTNREDAILAFGDSGDGHFPNYFEPTDHPPGSDDKIAVLRMRAELGQPLWHPQDRVDFEGWSSPIPKKLAPPNSGFSISNPNLYEGSIDPYDDED